MHILSVVRSTSRLCLSYFAVSATLYCILSSPPQQVFGGDDSATPNAAASSPIPGYCGLYCLHAAAQALGRDIEFASLVSHRYLGSRRGSSASELRQAAEDNGFHAQVMENLSCNVLPLIDVPAILHVRAKPTSADYDHWILFLGLRGGRAQVFDGRGETKLVSLQHLAGIWDGVGLLVSDKQIDMSTFYLFNTGSGIIIITTVCILGTVLFGINPPKKLVKHSHSRLWLARDNVIEACQIAVCAAALLGGLTLFSAGGFLADADAIAGIQERQIADLVPTVTKSELEYRIKNQKVLIIDARNQRDFQAGHVPEAINFPADKSATDQKVRTSFADYAKDIPVVVYCQSAGCNYDEFVGNLLVKNGFTNVSFFSGGWMEWSNPDGAN